MNLIKSEQMGKETRGSFYSHSASSAHYPLNVPLSIKVDCDEAELTAIDEEYMNSSIYRLCGLTNAQQFNLGIERAIARLLLPYVASNVKGYCGYGFDEEGNFFADYGEMAATDFNAVAAPGTGETDMSNCTHQIFKMDTKGDVYAYVVDEKGSKTKLAFDTKTNATTPKNLKHSPSGALYFLSAYMIESHRQGRFNNKLAEIISMHLQDAVDAFGSDDEKFVMAVRCLDNDIYQVFAQDSSAVDALPFIATKVERAEYKMLTDEEIQVNDMVGSSVFLTGEKVATSKGTVIVNKKTTKELAGKFKLNPSRVLTEEEEKLIPGDSIDDLVPNGMVVDEASLIAKSSFFRNVMWTGATGTGKSTSAAMLAKMLDIPYVFMTMNDQTLSSDLLVSILPATDAAKAEVDALKASLPTPTAIALDPVDAYKQITGKIKEDVTEQDCMDAMSAKYEELFSKSNGFVKVESPFIQAFKNGWLIEVQEANTCAKSGTLVALNSALDSCAQIITPYGEVIKRHPDCVVVMTANIGYAGRRPMDESIISRMHLCGEFELPEEDQFVKDLMNITGCKDEDIVKKMVKVMYGMQKVLEDNSYSKDYAGQREVICWIMKYLATNDPYKSALDTIVGTAAMQTQNRSGGADDEMKSEFLAQLELQFHSGSMPGSTILTY